MRRLWGEGWGDAWCQVSELIMALPAQSGRQLYKRRRGQEATKLACHTHASPAFKHTHPVLLIGQTAQRARQGK